MKTVGLLSKRYLCQYAAAFAGTLSIISAGIHEAWTSPYLPKIINGTTTGFTATSEESSWSAVVLLLGLPLGSFAIVHMVDRIGRKASLLVWAPVMVAVFLGLAFAQSITVVSLLRFVAGFAEGGLFAALPMYLSEISDAKVRGMLTGITLVMFRIGTLFINTVGLATSIFTSSLICCAFPVIHFFAFLLAPESPYYYLQKGSRDKAEETLRKLRGGGDVQAELKTIAEAMDEAKATKAGRWTDLFTIATNRRAFMIYTIVTLTNNFSGKTPFQFYTYAIFDAADATISAGTATIIFCCVEIAAMLLCMVLMDRFGRRPMLALSTLGCALSLIAEGFYFYFLQHDPGVVDGLRWLPVFALITYNVAFNLGLVFGPIIYMGEVFPTEIKAFALFLGNTLFVCSEAIASKFFQATADAFGMYFPFVWFSACCWFFLPCILKFVPETRGKTLEEIQELLARKDGKKSGEKG